MWKIYDELIATVPEDSKILECLVGLHWILVRSDRGVGIAMRPPEASRPQRPYAPIAGMRTRDLALWSKSWNFVEAAMGIAAINSVLNTKEAVEEWSGETIADHPSTDLFDSVGDSVKGKKVTVIGHFYGLDRLAEICDLSVLERRPLEGDLPDPACEYILPHQDAVIMTGTTLINKTMPRLLHLSRDIRVIVCGPTTPMSPLMFNHGVDLLAGLVVEEKDAVWLAIQEGAERELLATGGVRMVEFARPVSGRTGVAGCR